MMFIHDKYA